MVEGKISKSVNGPANQTATGKFDFCITMQTNFAMFDRGVYESFFLTLISLYGAG